MDRVRALTAAVAVVAALAVVCAVLLTQDDGEESWTITYETGGGTLPDGHPTSYSDDGAELPVPARDGYVFTGWYLDPDLTERIESIEPGTTGDLTLYAGWIPEEEHTVTYVLDGGTLPEGYGDTFIGGIGMTLPVPVRNGLLFAGWFYDPDFTQPVVVIGTDILRDVTVYACWDEDDTVGTGYLWDVSGTYYNGTIPHTMEGTAAREYVAEWGGEYYFETIVDITYSWPGGSTVSSGRSGAWADQLGTLAYVGVEEVDGIACTVWSSESGETYWLYHLRVPVRIALIEGTTEIVYSLSEVYRFRPSPTFTPAVTAEYPLSVDGVVETVIGDTVVLTAVGDGFTGWYSGSTLLTTDRVLTVSRGDPSRSYEARAADGYRVMDPGDDLDDYILGASVTDADGNAVSSELSDLDPGYYVATGRAGGITVYMEFFIDDVRTFYLQWEHEGVTYSVSLDILYSDVYMYGYSHPYGSIRISLGTEEYVTAYHTTDDPYLRQILDQISFQSSGMDRTDYAALVLSFVQNLRYQDDSESTGRDDYWKYPLETLWDGGGDCEDTTILYNTLMLMSGYQVAFLLFSDHAMSAVALDVDGHCVESDGVRYVFCETTTVSDIGLTSRGHAESDIYFWCAVSPATS